MKRWSRYPMFAVTILMVIAISAMQIVPVLADDGAPPPPEATEVVPLPQENPGSEIPPAVSAAQEPAPVAQEAAPAIPAAEEPATVVEQVPPVLPVAEEPVTSSEPTSPSKAAPAKAPAAEETTGQVLAQVPEGTDVVVLNEQGETVPLASQEAAEIIYTGDPIWCPVGVTPKAGVGGCSASFASLNLLVSTFVPTTNGVIWIEKGPASVTTAPVIIDGTAVTGNWASAAGFSLTLKGGWNGAGTTTISTTPSSFSNSLSITNWRGAITLSDIVISGASGSGYALDIQTTKAIILTNVDVVDNTTTNGAYLDNQNDPTHLSGVVINDSTFSGNSGTGLTVRSDGAVTAKNLSAYGNLGAGANIDNRTATTAKAVVMTGSNNFSFNDGGTGLTVLSKGAITLSNVNALFNAGQGANLDNCNYDSVNDVCGSGLVSGVLLKGSNNFNNNTTDGLQVYSAGAITAANLTANDNGGNGAFLNNYGAWLVKPITLTGANMFNGNGGSGLWLEAYGTATVNNVTANGNGSAGGCTTALCDGVHVEWAPSFLLNGYGSFNGNSFDGLDVYSPGLITLNNLYATENKRGAYIIDNMGAINLLGTNFFNDNWGTDASTTDLALYDGGLIVSSGGLINLSNITANNNNLVGAYVDNTSKWVYNTVSHSLVSVLAGQAVNLKGINNFNNNLDDGLQVFSSGIITTTSITAKGNDGSGAYLDNCLFDSTPAVNDCTGLAGKAVFVNGSNTFSDNLNNGLYVTSLGAIKVTNLNGNNNGGYGAFLRNSSIRALLGTVTLAGFATTNSNTNAGLGIFSQGTVVASNLTANNNGPTSSAVGEQSHNGVTIANDFNPAKSMNVTLLGINTFSGNYNTGLSVTSNGNIILTSLNANGNGDSGAGNLDPFGDGVFVDNSNATAIKTVTLNGANMFNGNLDLGLDIRSRGAIIVNKITANSNGEWGTYLYNQDGTSAAPVTIIGYGNFNNNLNNGTLTTGDEAGLAVFSNGAITLNNVIALSNANVGVYLDNERYTRGGPTDTAAPVNVTLNGNNTFNDNGLQGLMVFSDGLITLTNITANNNQSGAGVYADNQTRAKAGTANVRSIILKGWGTFTNNTGGEGLMILASGSISLTRVTANNNAGAGVIVDSANSSILFTCGSLNLNGDAGYILSGTVVTLKGVYSFGNGAANSVTGTQVFTRSCPLP